MKLDQTSGQHRTKQRYHLPQVWACTVTGCLTEPCYLLASEEPDTDTISVCTVVIMFETIIGTYNFSPTVKRGSRIKKHSQALCSPLSHPRGRSNANASLHKEMKHLSPYPFSTEHQDAVQIQYYILLNSWKGVKPNKNKNLDTGSTAQELFLSLWQSHT